jgi:hypothetical protein
MDDAASMIDLPPPELHAPLPHLLRGDSRKKQRGAGARGVHPHADAQLEVDDEARDPLDRARLPLWCATSLQGRKVITNENHVMRCRITQ